MVLRMSFYRVQTDSYNGPLDLLLYLIRQEEVDIYDIPIARITEEYVKYVDLLKVLDPDGVAEYLVLLATLIEIKSRTLVPRAPADEEEQEDLQDPRMDLVRRLLEYKKYKDAAYELAEAADLQAKRFPSRPVRIAREPDAIELEDLEIWELVAAFNRLMAQIGQGPEVHEVVYDDTPVALHAADIIDRLQREGGSLPFERIFLGRNRLEVIGLFLALLELIRQKRVRAEQEGLFGLIVVMLLSAAPLELAEDEDGGSAGLPAKRGEPAPPELAGAEQDRLGSHEPGEDQIIEGDDESEDAELQAIDAALDRVSDRLEEDRRRRQAADVAERNDDENLGGPE
jgi:segregation and condensation protein A